MFFKDQLSFVELSKIFRRHQLWGLLIGEGGCVQGPLVITLLSVCAEVQGHPPAELGSRIRRVHCLKSEIHNVLL